MDMSVRQLLRYLLMRFAYALALLHSVPIETSWTELGLHMGVIYEDMGRDGHADRERAY